MRKIYIFILFFISFKSLSQNLQKSPNLSSFNYVFKLNNKEAEKIIKKGTFAVDNSFLHTKVDSFQTVSYQEYDKKLEFGHYLIAYVYENEIVFEFKTVAPFEFKIVKNKTDLAIVLHDTIGNINKNAKVYFKTKKLEFNAQSNLYAINKYDKRGVINVDFNGVKYYYKLEQNQSRKSKILLRRVIYGFPFGYISGPIRDVYQSIKRGYPQGIVYKIKRRIEGYADYRYKTFKNIIILNKPKYFPNDTVRFKAIFYNQKGQFIKNKKLDVYLVSGYPNNNSPKKIIDVNPYRNGFYESYFVLNDTLNLRLGNYYSLKFQDNNSKEYGFKNLHFEDYNLKSQNYELRSDKNEFFIKDTIKVFAKGEDENGFLLPDVKIKVKVKLLSFIDTEEDYVFVPKLLWETEIKLNTKFETPIILPDSIFPRAKMKLSMEAEFVSADNQITKKDIEVTYLNKLEDLKFEIKNDSIFASSPSLNEKYAELDYYSSNLKLSNSKKIKLPYSEKLNPYIYDYELVNSKFNSIKLLNNVNSRFEIFGNRTKDSLIIEIKNPLNLPFWYDLFYKNKKIDKGYGSTDLIFKNKSLLDNNYYLSVHYVWKNELVDKEFTLSFDKNKLEIEANLPSVISPSANIPVNITVKNALGKPVSGVDITAFGITKKFKEEIMPIFPIFNNKYFGRKTNNDYNLIKGELEGKLNLNWDLWNRFFGLDTMLYFKFLYPQNQIFKHEINSGGLTEFAPFIVENGNIKAIQTIYVDKEPIYFRLTENGQNYSFKIDSGYHKLKIRTHNKEIIIDSLYISNGTKNIFSIDPSCNIMKVNVYKLENHTTAYELADFNNYILNISNNNKPNTSYVLKYDKVYPISDENRDFHAIGPIPSGYSNFKMIDNFKLDFFNEPGYIYEFQNQMLKLKCKNPLSKFKYDDLVLNRPNFNVLSIKEKDIINEYLAGKERKRYSPAKYGNPEFTSENKALLSIVNIKLPENRFIKHLIIFKLNDANFIRIYPGNAKAIHDLEPGDYKIMLIADENDYYEHDNIIVKPNGQNAINIDVKSFLSKTLKSIELNKLVIDSIYDPSNLTDQKIKETYYEVYNTQQSFSAEFTEFVEGYVYDNDKNGLPGVTISIKGTNKGVATNKDGYYKIYCPYNAVLKYSFIGFDTVERLTINNPKLNVSLDESSNALNEVVVVGYGASIRKNLTAAVSTVVGQELSGRAAGVQVRGSNTLSLGLSLMNTKQKPLLILDNVPFSGSIDDINKEEIESMEVLKGETAISLYGNRAINGVIMISTKKKKNQDIEDIQSQEYSIRKTFRDYAFWQPKLMTDKNGKASFKAQFPDDITQWNIGLVAVGPNRQLGKLETNIKTFKTLTASLTLPRFMVNGDTAQIYGKAQSYISDTVNINTSFENGKDVIANRISKLLTFKIDSVNIVAKSTDTLKIKFLVKAGNKTDGELRTIPVMEQGTLETVGTFNYIENDTIINFKTLASRSKIKIKAFSTPVEAYLEEISYLHNYKYLCNEQLASKLKGYLIEKQLLTKLNRPFKHDKDINKIIKLLQKNQNNENTWGWWNKSDGVSWISNHVINALIDAQKAGFSVDFKTNNIIQRELFILDSKLVSERVNALLVLSKLDTALQLKKYIKGLDTLKTLSFDEKLKIWELKSKLGLEINMDSLLKHKHSTILGGIYFKNPNFSPYQNDVLSTLSVYKILKNNNKNPQLLQQIRNYFFECKRNGYWQNTYQSSLILETLVDEIKGQNKNAQNAKLKVISKTGDILITKFPAELELTAEDNITISKDGSMPLFLSVSQEFHNYNPQKIENDFIVKTSFKDQSLNELKAGTLTILKVKVQVKKDAEYLMLEIPIPAGCNQAETSSGLTYGTFTEKYKYKTNVYFQSLKKGDYEFEVPLTVQFPGSYTLNPAKIELMYFPTFFARTTLKKVKIK